MTLQDLFETVAQHPWWALAYFSFLPLATYAAKLSHREAGEEAPWLPVYSALVYLACVPGILAATLCAYTIFFEGSSLLQVNVLVYFLPIVAMLATLYIMRRAVDLDRVPGFDKLSGLMLMIAASFVVMLLVQKTRIWVVFVGSVWQLFLVFVLLFLAFHFGLRRFLSAPKRP